MPLTNAVNELSSQHWVSGTARLAGALTVIFKLTVGAVIAVNLCKLMGLKPQIYLAQPQPQWIEWVALLVTAYGFAVLFKARLRDYPWVMAAAMASYVIARYAGKLWGNAEGVFLSAMVLTAAGNLFGRLMPKPGALIRVPGIIMLVPGSTSMRGFMDVVEQQSMHVGQDELLSVTNVVMALMAGLLFGNLFAPTRKNL